MTTQAGAKILTGYRRDYGETRGRAGNTTGDQVRLDETKFRQPNIRTSVKIQMPRLAGCFLDIIYA